MNRRAPGEYAPTSMPVTSLAAQPAAESAARVAVPIPSTMARRAAMAGRGPGGSARVVVRRATTSKLGQGGGSWLRGRCVITFRPERRAGPFLDGTPWFGQVADAVQARSQ